MRITIKLQQAAAKALHDRLENRVAGDSEGEGISQFMEIVQQSGGKLEAVHPGKSHRLLAPFFSADMPTTQSAESVIAALKKFEIVESAFLAPAPGLPNY